MFISDNPEQTAEAGAESARGANSGDVFALTGDLGAGKTQFVKGFVAGIGSRAEVTSPTFTLIHEYSDGRLPVYHFDFYRLGSADEATRLGLDDYLFGDGICIVEWADRFKELLPPETRWISFEVQTDTARAIRGLHSG
ncbi:MAG TPA: tRNA (adenosine(37)-N6)-threonylcarbamoyltransferase complex ATPase subunit type 1 TsaE [Chthoniobacterales bacterium]|nr:tRNA (adenosine(37)-N6)-threonylcarbamoyltransferase complex ATPase subunit type 1 TsaE [Chthoniobacterales bacterium]